jgi:hypothetical protein
VSEHGGLDLKALVPWLIATVMTIIAWFCRRDMGRYDDGLKRIEVLERNTVTYDHLDKVLDQMRNDRAAMHAENQNSLDRIEAKIDANEERSSNSRHAIRDEVHALALKIAVNKRARDS